MSCDYPRKGYPNPNGRGLVFDKPQGHSGVATKVRCHNCTGCRLDHRTNWSTRMMHEASGYEHNQFITFTYAPEHLPKNGDLEQVDMQLFFKRARKELGPMRYVYSGEYGTEKSRPHYHAVIFGLYLTDLIEEDTNERGDPLYGSATLDRLWGKGHCVIGAVTPQTCAYVAGYMLKDSMGNYHKKDRIGKPQPYETLDVSTGELTQRKRPFARYSNRPGIGKRWIEQYWSDVFPDDCCSMIKRTGNGQWHIVKRPVPPYYFDQLEHINPEMHAAIKAKRAAVVQTDKFKKDNTPARKRSKAICREAIINLVPRGTELSETNTLFIIDNEPMREPK